MSPGVLLVIQARMGSSRLPGKVLRPIGGRPMLAYQLARLRRCAAVDTLVVATSTQPADDAIERFCSQEAVACIRGPEDDVLRRFAMAATAYPHDLVVRVTADCPLIEPELVDTAVATLVSTPGTDYVSNMLEPSWPYGMAVEVMTRAALLEADREATDPAEREHVTPFLYWRPGRFRLHSMTRTPDLSGHRWTVDTAEDFELVSRLLGALSADPAGFRIDDVLQVLQAHPDWADINRDVPQRSAAPHLQEST